MKIDLYCIINNNRIASEKVAVFNDIDKLASSIINDKEKDNIVKFLYLDLILDDENRKQLMIKIFSEFNNQEMLIKYYLIMTDSNIIGIKKFDAIKDNIEEIENIGYDNIKKEVTLDNIENKLEEYNKKIEESIDKIEYIQNIVYIGSIYHLYDNEIENHKKDMNDSLVDIVKTTREKLVNEDKKYIKNEFDLLSEKIEKLLNGKTGLEIISCSYNGQEISYDSLIEEIFSHKFPEFMTEKNIMDTLDDEYIIEANFMDIIRTKGGKIDIRLK